MDPVISSSPSTDLPSLSPADESRSIQTIPLGSSDSYSVLATDAAVASARPGPGPAVSNPRRSPDRAHPYNQFHEHPGLLHAIQSLIYIIVVAIFIITFSVQPFRIPSGSMEPTLLIGDFLLVNKQVFSLHEPSSPLPPSSIHRGEIIVFHYPIDPAIHLVKRIVGMPGDHLKLREGRVFINGVPLSEPYAMYSPSGPDNFRDNFPRLQSADPNIDSRWWIRMRTLIDDGELIIPADNYFVLGDNRNNSEDSRYWGFVPRSAIVGQPILVYFSLQLGTGDAPGFTPRVSGREHSTIVDSLADFARWDRTLRIVH